jgi:predicted RNA-binding protein
MAFWLYITNSHNWRVTRNTNILGASEKHRNTLSRINEGDTCLVYVISERSGGEMIGSHIVAEYRVVSKVFEDDDKIFQAPETTPSEGFRLRMRLEPMRIFENPISFKPLVPKLVFIKNKQRWSLNIRGRAVVEVPKHDYMIIAGQANINSH